MEDNPTITLHYVEQALMEIAVGYRQFLETSDPWQAYLSGRTIKKHVKKKVFFKAYKILEEHHFFTCIRLPKEIFHLESGRMLIHVEDGTVHVGINGFGVYHETQL
jgi:hypothetical protein